MEGIQIKEKMTKNIKKIKRKMMTITPVEECLNLSFKISKAG